MGKKLPETCRADSKVNKIVVVVSSWSFILFTYVDDAQETQIKFNYKMSLNILTKIIWKFPSIATVSTDYSFIKYFYLLMDFEIAVSLGIFLGSSRATRNL